MENRNLIIVAIVAGLLVLGGVGYAAFTGGTQQAQESQSVPAQQLVGTEQPQQQQQSGSDGQAHSTE
jgi:flagellar basal body-associated protein FliL